MDFPPMSDAVLAALGPSYNYTVVNWLKEQTMVAIHHHKQQLDYHQGVLDRLKTIGQEVDNPSVVPPMSPSHFTRPTSGGARPNSGGTRPTSGGACPNSPQPIKLADLAKKRGSVAPTPRSVPNVASPASSDETVGHADVKVTFSKPKAIKPVVDEAEQGAQAMTHFTKPTARKMNKAAKTPKFDDIEDTPIAHPGSSLSVTLPLSPSMEPTPAPSAFSEGDGLKPPPSTVSSLNIATPRAGGGSSSGFSGRAVTPSGVKLPPGAVSMFAPTPMAAKSMPTHDEEPNDRSGTPAVETMDLDEIYAGRGGVAPSHPVPPPLPGSATPSSLPSKASHGPPPLPKGSLGPPPIPTSSASASSTSSLPGGGSKPPPLPGMPPPIVGGGPPPLPSGGSVSGRPGPPPIPPPNSAPLSSVQRLSNAFEQPANKPPPGAHFNYMNPSANR